MENMVFGIRPVAEAIESGQQIERLYIRKGGEGQLLSDLRDLALRHRVRMQEVPVEKLNRLVKGNHQGVVAQISPIEYVTVEDIMERVPEDETPLIVIFDGVTDVRNFGAIAPAPPVVEPLRVARMAADGVAIVKLFPGISEQMLRAMLSAEGLQGVVLETYGAGNAPTSDWFLQLMRQTVERGVTVLNVTQCDSGSVEMQLYETGQQLRAAGVISGYDITTEAAVTKLMYVMGKNLTPNYRHELMARPVKGEFTL